MNKQEKMMAILLGLCLVGWLWYSVDEQKKAAELRGAEIANQEVAANQAGGSAPATNAWRSCCNSLPTIPTSMSASST